MSEEKMTPEDAVKLLEEEREARAQEASSEVNAALEKYRCVLHTIVELAPSGQFAVSYRIVAQ